MSDELFVLLSGLLSFGAPLALAIRELMLLRRGGGGEAPRRNMPQPGPAPIGGDAPPRRALPANLIPPYPVRPLPLPRPAETREAERV